MLPTGIPIINNYLISSFIFIYESKTRSSLFVSYREIAIKYSRDLAIFFYFLNNSILDILLQIFE